jgi:hypothetical protein
MTTDANLQSIRDQLPPAKSWTYTHDSGTTDITVACGHCWPEVLVVVEQRGTGLRISGQFAADGRLRQFTIETTRDGVEVTAAALRRLPAIRSLRQWEEVGRAVAAQILDGVPDSQIVIDGRSPTEALRMLASAAGRAPRAQRRRGADREELIREVAQAYREAIAAGDQAPRAALAQQFGYSRAHIARLVGAARQPRNGQPPLLGLAQHGKAGEMLQTDP